MKKNFYDIFQVHPDGSIEPKTQIRIGGVSLGQGVRLGKGVAFSGIDISQYIGRDFEIEESDKTLVLTGIY